MKRTIGAMLMVGLLGAFAGPASAQEYPPEVLGEVEVSDSTVVCGEDSITLTGSGWEPGTPVSIVFKGETIGTATPDASGSFSATVDIPSAAEGTHNITVTQDSDQQGTVSGSASISCVLGELLEQGPAAGGLATTGANITVWLAIVVALLLAGGAALVAGRRSSQA